MHIYDSTQVLHKVDQYLKTGPIPVLIMNHLPLEKKSVSKFDNYCAFLNRNIFHQAHLTFEYLKFSFIHFFGRCFMVNFLLDMTSNYLEGIVR